MDTLERNTQRWANVEPTFLIDTVSLLLSLFSLTHV